MNYDAQFIEVFQQYSHPIRMLATFEVIYLLDQ